MALTFESEFKTSFQTPWGGLLPFQQAGYEEFITSPRQRMIANWDTGLGKSVLGLSAASYLIETATVDQVWIICEKNKLEEWVEDTTKFTKLSVKNYAGTPAIRKKIRRMEAQMRTNVMVCTYETFRMDLIELKVTGGVGKGFEMKDLYHSLLDLKILVIFDEVSKIRNRASKLHQGLNHWVKSMEQYNKLWMMGLTGTKMEKSPEDFYNLGRVFCPDRVGTVESFEHDHVTQRDFFGNNIRFKNLSTLAAKMTPVMMVKSKKDPDVIDQFPEQAEIFTHVGLDEKHKDFLRTLAQTFGGTAQGDAQLWGLLRMVAGHPLGLMRSKGELAQFVVEEVGERGLACLGSAKTTKLLDLCWGLVQEDVQIVVFTFFGQSVLPLLEKELTGAGLTVAINHGGLTNEQKTLNKNRFTEGEVSIYLSSDAGSRGINLPQASYVINYELPLLYSTYIQRINRCHRIDSPHKLVTCNSLIAKGTVEEDIANLVLKRNEWDELISERDSFEEDVDSGLINATARREMIQASMLKR